MKSPLRKVEFTDMNLYAQVNCDFADLRGLIGLYDRTTLIKWSPSFSLGRSGVTGDFIVLKAGVTGKISLGFVMNLKTSSVGVAERWMVPVFLEGEYQSSLLSCRVVTRDRSLSAGPETNLRLPMEEAVATLLGQGKEEYPHV